MIICKILVFLLASFVLQLFFADGVWAWGPAVHTVLGCRILEEATQILPAIAGVIRAYPLEYLYGSLSADFFIGKGQKRKNGHSHNWETGFRFLREVKSEKDTAYALGFLSHLAADVVAHNYFIPNLISQASNLPRMGHVYWETRADCSVGPLYIKMARDILSMEQLECDDLLRYAVGKGRKAIRTKRHLFTQYVKFSDFFYHSPPMVLIHKGSKYQISYDYLRFMIDLSYRLVKNLLNQPIDSLCLLYDPIGSRNLRLAGKKAILSRLFKIPRPRLQFQVDRELLQIR
ncbi:MAG: zinc dependent phospholipase C family protein [Deltaproteobacteria bacterium]|nr:zinc dependent phospholipase C family protein [Deltaproteobacteria bacterium]MBW2139139.1 zinc dependent phospholipase C family protein [Deltaproteobacteria bacterium]